LPITFFLVTSVLVLNCFYFLDQFYEENCNPGRLLRVFIFNFLSIELIFIFGMQGAVNFALMMSQMEGGCPVDYNTITDLFLQVC
jgi:hypothetical protein